MDEEDGSLEEACARVLSADEQARASRFRSSAARCRFVRCRAALRALVHAYRESGSPTSVVFDQGPFGKPVLRSRGRARLHFNVSHTAGMGVIALASAGPIGVDVERIHDIPERERLADRCFFARERVEFAAVEAPARSLAFFQGWTRKEAFLKATGEGLSHGLHELEVSLRPEQPARFLRVPGSPGAERDWSLHSFEPAPGYTAAVAAPWPDSTMTLFDGDAASGLEALYAGAARGS